MSIFQQGMFTTDPNMTPQQVAQKRALMAMLRPRYGSARYVGEGLGQLATGFVEGRMNRKLDDIEGAGRDNAASIFSGLFGRNTPTASTSGGGPMNILGVDQSKYPIGTDGPVTPNAITPGGYAMGVPVQPDYVQSIIGTESGGRWDAKNSEMGAGGKPGHFGRVQFGQARLQEAMNAGAIPQGVTPEQFMASPELQMEAEQWHFADLESQLGDLVGKEVNGQVMDMGALVAMGHLGGAAGARKYVESGGAYNPSDSFGTSLSDYAQKHGGKVSMSTQGGTPQIPMDDLLAALSNPWLAPEQRAVLMSVYDQQMQASDPMNQLALEKAQLEVDAMKAPPGPPADYMERTFMAEAAGLVKGTPEYQTYLLTGELPEAQEPGFRTMTADEVTQMGLPPGAYQVGPSGEIKQIGGGGVTVNNDLSGGKFDEAFAKGDADTLKVTYDAGLAAQRNLGRIDQLSALLGSTPTGFGAALASKAGEWGLATEGLDQLQAAQALINSLVPEQRQPGSGPMSDADLALFKESLPRLIVQPGGNRIILDTMRAIAEYDAEGASIVQRLRNGEITRAQAFDMLQNRPNPLAAMSPGGSPPPVKAAPAGSPPAPGNRLKFNPATGDFE